MEKCALLKQKNVIKKKKKENCLDITTKSKLNYNINIEMCKYTQVLHICYLCSVFLS